MMSVSLLDRLLDLARTRPGLALLKGFDAWFLGPLAAQPAWSILPHCPSSELGARLQSPGPIHWLRPGGMGDWAVLAPFIQGVRAVRKHPEDTLWVTEAALPLASTFHRSDGIQVRALTPRNLFASPPPALLLQTELFHPMAWLVAALLRPESVAGFPLPDPRSLELAAHMPMHLHFQTLHPGIQPHGRPRTPQPSGPIVCFPQGNHPSRRLPPGIARALQNEGFAEVTWIGPWEGGPRPTKWSFPEVPLGPDALLAHVSTASAVLSPDSGPFHLARLLGIPALGYFTSGDLLQWGWEEPARRSFQSTFPCTGCTRFALPVPCPHSHACVEPGDAPPLAAALRNLTLTLHEEPPPPSLSKSATPRHPD